MGWHVVSLKDQIKCGSEGIPEEKLEFLSRAMDEDEIDEFTHTRAMRATVTNTDSVFMRFEVICDENEVDQAKVLLTRLISSETVRWQKHYQKIAALVEY